MKKELASIKEENEILKKDLSIFAKKIDDTELYIFIELLKTTHSQQK